VTVLDAPRVDTIILDETILDDAPACGFQHNVTTCSVHVTHLFTSSCGARRFACTNVAEWKRMRAFAVGVKCRECGKPAADCWRIVPI
jgi:hypothetical protein